MGNWKLDEDCRQTNAEFAAFLVVIQAATLKCLKAVGYTFTTRKMDAI